MKDHSPLPRAIAALLCLSPALCLVTNPARAQSPPALRDLQSDTWVATDALGRTLPAAGEARRSRQDKFVGIFYFVWHSRADEPYDNTKALAADPANPVYGPVSAFHWWGEPAVGYFRADDPWVARKNLQMLGDAGVDVLFVDVTNAVTYPADVKTLLETAAQMRREGCQTPQVGFLTHAATAQVVTRLYDTYYREGLYADLWFRWDGKPLLLGDKTTGSPQGQPFPPAISDFFTWRNSWAWDPGQDKWQWLDKYPQRPGWHTDPGTPEEVPVSVAGHPTDQLGRSYHSDEAWGHGTEPPADNHLLAADVDYGLQFAQQWKQALEIDPQFIFVTGWNEWIAQRFTSGAGGGPGFLGRVLRPGETFFVDNYNEEFSRDIMPMKGGYGDNYYLQLVDGIRRFKGIRPLPVAHGFQTLSVQSAFAAWDRVQPHYLDAVGDTLHRDHNGWAGHRYTETSGRNDITSAKVACDAKTVCFYVHTQDKLTPFTDPNWMQLLVDADANAKTGWNGYDFLVNSRVLSPTKTTLKRLSDGKTWSVSYRAAGNEMQIALPRALLGMSDLKKTTFDFHWVDNAPVGGAPKRIVDWWYIGESAPDGRFNYRYRNIR